MTRTGVVMGGLLLSQQTYAHDSFRGNSLIEGLLLPLQHPEQWLLLVAIGLWLGQQGGSGKYRSLSFQALVCCFAAIAGLLLARQAQAHNWMLVCAAVAGLLVAVSFRIPVMLTALAVALGGFLVAFDVGQDIRRSHNVWLVGLGALAAVVAVFTLARFASGCFRRGHWQRVLMRIVGSWIAASALLVLSLALIE